MYAASTRLPGSVNFSAGYDYILADMGWFHFDHISCKGPRGVCVLSSGGTAGDAFAGEIYLVYTNGRAADNEQNDQARVRRITHHRSSSRNYWAQPQPSISADGSYIIYASDWGQQNGSVDSYIIDLRNRDISAPAPVGSSTGSSDTNTSNTGNNTVQTPQTNTSNTDTGSSSPSSGNSSGEPFATEVGLGANGLPNSTYAPQGTNNNFVLGTWFGNPAQKNYVELLTINYLGNNCSNIDFANIRFFIQLNKTGNYTRIEPNTYLDTSDSGCGMKSNVRTVISLSPGTHNIVACVANDDFGNNYCTNPMTVTTNANGQSW